MLKSIVKRMIYRERYNSDTYIDYLRKLGVRIGVRTTVYDPRSTFIDPSRPYLIQIGNDVQITRGGYYLNAWL